jgi:TetR/AcrR family transcriptional repressor of lmrAB and yxaGH operons
MAKRGAADGALGRREQGSSREAFVRATGKLLRRQGYDGTGLNEIVAASGAPKGSLYFHFPEGKESLAAAAMVRESEALRDAIAGLLGSGEDLVESLAALLDAMSAGLERSGYRDGCPLATVTLERAAGSAALREAAAAGFGSWVEQIELRLRDAGLPAEVAARKALVLLSAIEGALILARARRDPAPLAAVRAELPVLLA